MQQTTDAGAARRDAILNAAIAVFGRYGYKKASMDDLAAAAGLSKQGLYLHFASKEEVFTAAMRKYLDDGLALVGQALGTTDAPLLRQLAGAMDAWFGRHFDTFTPASFDVIEAGDRLSGEQVGAYKAAFQSRVAKALANSAEFRRANNVCSPKEIAQVLFLFGLTWKEGHASRAEFMKKATLCIRACCQVQG